MLVHACWDLGNLLCKCVAKLYVLVMEQGIYISHKIISQNASSYKIKTWWNHLMGETRERERLIY